MHSSDELFREAKNAFVEGNYKLAEHLLNQLILNHSKNPEIFQMLATIYYDRGQFNKAIRTFKRALEIDPTYTDASIGLSIILNDLGRYEEGRQVFLEAEKILEHRKQQADPYLDEKLASKHEELADLYLQSRRPKEALEQLLKAQKLSARKAEISLRIADCYSQIGEDQRAIQTLKSLIKDYPNFLAARMKLGNLYYRLNQLVEATEMWESVLARDPNHKEAAQKIKMAQAVGVTDLHGL
ncbi:MAG: tetratricopeptide repeat protein [Bdellovibrionaceae bacterium]|nr:tetratricopeptide repeat protein [Pseudobdellovibrionaceae bacterium]MDW8189564.1 tetratricopeptide repeat protein [Pseudobdellovibrionaceae bacterium]